MPDWKEEKERKRLERDMKRVERALAAPPARGEMLNATAALERNVASVAFAIEALERVLIGAGFIADGDLLAEMESIVHEKQEQIAAQAAAEAAASPRDSLIIGG